MGRGGVDRGIHHVGSYRKFPEKIGWGRWCMKRICVALLSIASVITLASVASESFQTALFYPRKLVHTHRARGDYGRNHLRWERRGQGVSFDDDSFESELLLQSVKSDSDQFVASHLGKRTSEDVFALPIFSTSPYIEDIVALPEGLDLFLVRQFSEEYRERISACKYGNQLKSKLKIVDFVDGRLAVSCMRPAAMESQLNLRDVSLEVDGGESPALMPMMEYQQPHRWDSALVYAVQSTDEDVIIYVKRLFEKKRQGKYTNLKNFRCVFGKSIQTEVTAAAQEVFRCPHPEFEAHQHRREKVSLLYKSNLIPSVAYYDASARFRVKEKAALASSKAMAQAEQKQHLVCSCTMIWNSAKFLKEWVLYNSDLGVEKFFLYDNNSEDDVENVVSSLSQFNVTRLSWPWVKTQEAGFSHCVIEAQRECTWVLFTDVDEYLFPKRWLEKETESSSGVQTTTPLADLIDDTLARWALRRRLLQPGTEPQRVGQISFLCRNYGPSGLTTHPSAGVTQGYTCRDLREQRHKSLVYFPALDSSLQNVIHHFQLRPEFQTMYLDPRQAVVNHFKFQAWSEFQTKFTKRASTYVTDWKEPKNLNSQDRPEGVGPEAKKPVDWETRHCQINDTALRDYTRRRFGILGEGDAEKMAWEV